MKEIRFHSKSQTEMNHKPAALDAEVVHKSKYGKPFILVILFETGKSKNPVLSQLPWNSIQRSNKKKSVNNVDLDYLLPKTWAYYHYVGSHKGSGKSSTCKTSVPYAVMHYRTTMTKAQLGLFPANSKYKSISRTQKKVAFMYNKFFFAGMHKPQDCIVRKWSPWSKCTKTCATGTQTRSRTLIPPRHGGKACTVSPVQKRKCNKQKCPVDCVVAAWTAYSKCTKTCGTGKQYRTRGRKVKPAYGGKGCPKLDQKRTCNKLK